MVYSKTASLRGETEADAEHVQQVCGLCNDLADDPVVSYQFFLYLCSNFGLFVCSVHIFFTFSLLGLLWTRKGSH